MSDENKARLDFKRQFLLQNITAVKDEWYRFDQQREKFRFLFLTVWFGTTAIFVKDNDIITYTLGALLTIETLVFASLEEYFNRASKRRLIRISVMETWIMNATDTDILSMNGPLAKLDELKNIDQTKLGPRAFWEGKFHFLFLVFLVMSILIKPLLDLLFYLYPLSQQTKCCCC